MADDASERDALPYGRRKSALSRREFGTLTLGAGLSSALPIAARAATEAQDVEIKTADGTADAYFVHPQKQASAGVLMWPDIFGLRPAFKQMATRLAEAGYAVLVVNPFYRRQRAPTAPEHPNMDDPPTREKLMGLYNSLNAETTATDAKAFIPYLDAQSAVDRHKKLGTAGYCMGGPLTLRTAAAFPARVGAGASFHGGGLVTEKPDSPHLLIPKIKAHYLFAIAANDDQKDPKAKDVLRESFARAHLPAEIEVYAGTQHGWCPTDSRVYDHDQAEKAWSRMLALFKTALA
ncbi:MAG: dienelactone hydrolase family protein [Sinobacteraceae bacterium]|nr:dienelactone hydrolase family protein [Nevskiaceae bacterium]